MLIIKVAINKKGYIGKDNKMMWHCKEDLIDFKNATQGNIVVMGKNTYDSIGCLPNRTNYVVTHDNDCPCRINLVDIIDLAKRNTVYLIGGANIIHTFIKMWSKKVDRVELSMIDNDDVGDCKLDLCLINEKIPQEKIFTKFYKK